MTRNDTPRLHPVSTTPPGGEAALLVDEAAAPSALYREADVRLTAAQGMLSTAALAGESSGLDGRDLQNIAQAAQILTSDAMDLMSACNLAYERAIERAAPRIHQFSHHEEA